MIVVDSSAIIAIMFKEKGFDAFLDAISSNEHPMMSTSNFVEACVVASFKLDKNAYKRVDTLLTSLEVDICDLTKPQAMLARDAYMRYGKGRHKAGLNICDCFSYALAKDYDAPLLFKGNDFLHTDIEAAL